MPDSSREACGSLTFTVATAPQVTTHPASQSVAPGGTASFSAAASGSPSPTAQSQVRVNNGSTWSDIGGAISTTYSFAAAIADTGKQYRAVFTNSAGSATTAQLASRAVELCVITR